MNIREQVLNWLLKGKAAQFQFTTDTHTGGVSRQMFDAEADVKAERVDPNVATVLRIVSGAVSFLPLDVMEIEYDEDGKIQYIDDNDHPANDLIREPSPIMTTAEYVTYIVQSYLLAGNFFSAVESPTSDSYELWPIQPWRVSLKHENTSGLPNGFVVDKHRPGEINYEWDEIIHIKNMNLTDPFYGRSGIEPIKQQILGDYYSDRYNTTFFRNNAVPGSIFIPDVGIDEPQAEQISEAWNRGNQGPNKAHKNFILPHPGKLETPAQPLKDMAFGDYSRMNREKIFSVLGIPPFLGGVNQYANYANAKIQEETYWRHTIIPLLNIIADALTRQLLWTYFDREHVFRFDISGVHALQADKLKQSQRLRLLTPRIGTPGIITQNEARNELGYQPVEGGDELSVGGPSMSPGIEVEPSKSIGGGNGEGDQKGAFAGVTLSKIALRSASPSDYKKKQWKAFDNFTRKKEIGYSRVMVKFFNVQRNRIIDALDEITGSGKMLRTGLYEINRRFQRKDSPLDEDDAGKLFDFDVEDAALIEGISPFIRKVIYDSGQRVGDQYAIDMIFNLDDPNVLIEIEKMLNRSTLINETSYQNIKRVLHDAQEQAWALSQIEKQIKVVYRDASKVRLPMIARTEMLRAVNGGTLLGYEQGAIEKKEWLASMDANTRDSHANLDGEVVETSKTFTRGYFPMMYPGDPSAPASETINCRCTLLPVLGE